MEAIPLTSALPRLPIKACDDGSFGSDIRFSPTEDTLHDTAVTGNCMHVSLSDIVVIGGSFCSLETDPGGRSTTPCCATHDS